jgi:hypothetical protein
MYPWIYSRVGSCWKCNRHSRTRAHAQRPPFSAGSYISDAAERQTAHGLIGACSQTAFRPALPSAFRQAQAILLLGHAPHDRTCADDDLQLDADCARFWPRCRHESPPVLPQERQASLHDAHGAIQRQTERLHIRLGKVPMPAGKHLCGSFSNLSPENQAAVPS